MDSAVFGKSAAFIAQRNASERVVRILAGFDPASSSLRLLYCTESAPMDDDWQDLELACGELIAEFPEIMLAETDCVAIGNCIASGDLAVVFSRS